MTGFGASGAPLPSKATLAYGSPPASGLDTQPDRRDGRVLAAQLLGDFVTEAAKI
jgi:hypothetical protein